MFPIIVFFTSLIYPSMKTYLIIASENRKVEEINHWLAYWFIYSFYQILSPLRWFLSMIIPYFNMLEALFFLYLVNSGSPTIYAKIIGPYLIQSGFSKYISLPIEMSNLVWKNPKLLIENMNKYGNKLSENLNKHPELKDVLKKLNIIILPCKQILNLTLDFIKILQQSYIEEDGSQKGKCD